MGIAIAPAPAVRSSMESAALVAGPVAVLRVLQGCAGQCGRHRAARKQSRSRERQEVGTVIDSRLPSITTPFSPVTRSSTRVPMLNVIDKLRGPPGCGAAAAASCASAALPSEEITITADSISSMQHPGVSIVAGVRHFALRRGLTDCFERPVAHHSPIRFRCGNLQVCAELTRIKVQLVLIVDVETRTDSHHAC